MSKIRPSINWLFLFVPLSVVVERMEGVSEALVFFLAALAIVPVAHLIVEATGKIAEHTGEAVGGLLNATFGNAPELIIALVALRAGHFEMVSASLIGAILANILLAQGISSFIGGLRYHDQAYNPTSIRVYSSMMLVAVVSLAIPSAFGRAFGKIEGAGASVVSLNIAMAVMLLLTYVLYLLFTLRTHKQQLAAVASATASDEHGASWSVQRALLTLLGASVLAAFLSEILVGSSEGAGRALGMSESFIGLICVAIVGGAAESLSAITMGARNRMDLSFGIAFGSSIQIALFVAPVLVLLSHFIAPQPFNLMFNGQLLGFLLLSVLLGAIVSGDGHSNWFKGVQLIVFYLMLAVTLYLFPAGA